MKKTYSLLVAIAMTVGAMSQTLNVTVGCVTYQFPSSQTGDMTYTSGTTLTIMGKTFALNDINAMTVDESEVTDNTVRVVYEGSSASVVIAGNVAQYLTPTISNAHVSIAQSNDLAQEITYTLSGVSSDGEFYMSGDYKATVEFNGLTLTNTNPVYSGAAVHIQNGKRIKIKVCNDTENSLTDASNNSQKGCLYVKGHAEFAQKGILNIVGKVKHGIKTGEYMTLKNATLNITSAVGDGINCTEYFLMESGTVNISGVDDDGIQCDIDGNASTGETTDHEEEDSGNIYLQGGTININVTANAAKGIKGEGDMTISGGTITVGTSGGGLWDSTKQKTKACACLGADGNIIISGGNLDLTSTGAGGKGINGDGTFTATGGTLTIHTSGHAVAASSNGTLTTITNSRQLESYDSDHKSSPKGIKVDGALSINGDAVISVTTTGAGGEGIESKNSITISGGQTTVNASDDGINASYTTVSGEKVGTGDLTISGGYVYARSSGNDGLDANGNCYIKGGLVYAIGSSQPEVAIDANSEEHKKLYVSGGTLVAIGGLENGASLSQSCYYSSSWSSNTWYAMTYGGETFAFKTPASGGNKIVVSASTKPTLKKSVSVSGGTTLFDGVGNIGGTITETSNTTTVSLSSYTGGGGGPGPWPW